MRSTGKEKDIRRWPPKHQSVDQTNESLGTGPPDPDLEPSADAIFGFLGSIKETYKDDVDIFHKFMGNMRDYKARRISIPELVENVEALFKDHEHLILGFRAFVPEDFDLKAEKMPKPADSSQTLPYIEKPKNISEQPMTVSKALGGVKKNKNILKEPVDNSQALAFIKMIRRHYANLYNGFLRILVAYRDESLPHENVFSQVADLCKNHPKLMEEFTAWFFPHDPSECCALKVNKKSPNIELRNVGDQMDDDIPEFKCRTERSVHQNYVHTFSKKNRRKLEKQVHKIQREHRKLMSVQKPAEENVPACFEQKENVSKIPEELLREQVQSHERDTNATVPIISFLNRNLNSLTVIKDQLHNTEKFEEFLKCLLMHSDNMTTLHDFNLQIVDIFLKAPELIYGSINLVRQCETAELDLLLSEKQQVQRYECRKQSSSQTVDENESETNTGQGKKRKRERPAVLDANIGQEREIHKHPLPNRKFSSTTNTEEEYENKPQSFRDIPNHRLPSTTNMEYGDESTRHTFMEISNFRSPSRTNMEQDNEHKRYPSKETIRNKPSNKYLNKRISELNLSNCEQCTPSYRRLPDDYPLPAVGSRTSEGSAVLNDTWILATSGREQYYNKCMNKNEYEESLHRCEEDRYELDMLIESTDSTIEALEGLLQIINKGGEIIIRDHMTAIQLRVIERIYGDFGLEVFEYLHQKMDAVALVILDRLKQKRNEWLQYKEKANKIWADVLAKHHQKSLDHRSIHDS